MLRASDRSQRNLPTLSAHARSRTARIKHSSLRSACTVLRSARRGVGFAIRTARSSWARRRRWCAGAPTPTSRCCATPPRRTSSGGASTSPIFAVSADSQASLQAPALQTLCPRSGSRPPRAAARAGQASSATRVDLVIEVKRGFPAKSPEMLGSAGLRGRPAKIHHSNLAVSSSTSRCLIARGAEISRIAAPLRSDRLVMILIAPGRKQPDPRGDKQEADCHMELLVAHPLKQRETSDRS